jgi:hypothetical protein
MVKDEKLLKAAKEILSRTRKAPTKTSGKDEAAILAEKAEKLIEAEMRGELTPEKLASIIQETQNSNH